MTTLVTAEQIASVRRMVAEPTITPYTDVLITAFIELYPVVDIEGEEPFELTGTRPPVKEVNPEWMPTYDLNSAAADIWAEKAGTWANKYDFGADGSTLNRSQVYRQSMQQSRYYRSRRVPGTVTLVKFPDERGGDDVSYIGNVPEDDE